jgi:hypothetical protein
MPDPSGARSPRIEDMAADFGDGRDDNPAMPVNDPERAR